MFSRAPSAMQKVVNEAFGRIENKRWLQNAQRTLHTHCIFEQPLTIHLVDWKPCSMSAVVDV